MWLAESVNEDLSEIRDDVAIPRELMLQCVVDTFLTALTWCLEKRPKLAPSEVNDMFRHLVTRGIGRAIAANGRRSARSHQRVAVASLNKLDNLRRVCALSPILAAPLTAASL